jgi:D-alanyl-D-alanine carboxypeptidase
MGSTSKFAAVLVALGVLLASSVPSLAADRLQRDADALRALGVTGVLARLDTPTGTRTARSGVAEVGTTRPVPTEPHLRTASITKTFVATVILQLVAEGELELSDPVERWLPGVVTGNGNDGRKITIRQLLQQTSGLYNYSLDIYPSLATPEDYRRNRWQTATPSELVAIAMRHAPTDQTWTYVNTNYVLAGLVIKAVTGNDWSTEVRNRVIIPLHLRSTSLPGTWPFLPQPHARNYQQWTPGGELADTTIAVRRLDSGSDGSIISTAVDLNTFFSALIGGRLLPAAQLAEMRTTVTVPPDSRGLTAYGLGLYYRPLPCGGGAWNHGGNGLGYNTEVITTGTTTLTLAEFSRTFDPAVEEPREKARWGLVDRALCGA